jgi:hypothetical protein
MKALFLHRTNWRTLPEDYQGDVLIWDIDKTYLDTRFSSLMGLVGLVLEAAVDKQAIPGAAPLVRALRRGPARNSSLTPLYFVSGSPKELRPILERKMILDGVDFDGITFKDQLGLLKALRPRALAEQVGYKLCALLQYRRELPAGARYLMFGDDVEADARVFALFGEVCAGLRGKFLSQRMLRMGAHPYETEAALELSQDLPVGRNPVERIFIRLERHSNPERVLVPGAAVVPFRSYLQAALVLAGLGRIRNESISAVAEDIRRNHLTEAVIEAELEDATRRLGVDPALLAHARA